MTRRPPGRRARRDTCKSGTAAPCASPTFAQLTQMGYPIGCPRVLPRGSPSRGERASALMSLAAEAALPEAALARVEAAEKQLQNARREASRAFKAAGRDTEAMFSESTFVLRSSAKKWVEEARREQAKLDILPAGNGGVGVDEDRWRFAAVNGAVEVRGRVQRPPSCTPRLTCYSRQLALAL